MNSFDKRAKTWDKEARRRALAKAAAEAILPYLPEGSRIADFGCGTGLLSYNLLAKASKIVGIDTSVQMRKIFNEKSPDPHRFYAIERFEEEIFDAIVTSMTLHHIEDLDSLAKTFAARLRKGGILAIVDLVKEDGSFHDAGNAGVHHFGFDPEWLAAIFERCGFEKLEQKIIYRVQKHKPFPIFLLLFRYTLGCGADPSCR